VERFQQGDSAAFDVLYQRYFARLQRFCLKRVGDRSEAEEIAQEAFARAFRALPGLAGERRFYPWMTVIAGRLCVDHHRRRRRSEPSAVIDLGAVEGGQEAVVERADLPLLFQALQQLAPRHAEVLDLREQRGWSYQAIADHYDVSVGTVEALLFRARKALKREYLALAGGDRWAAFGALPVLGTVARRWSWLKAKAAALSAAAGPAVASLGVAAVVGSVAVVGVAVIPGGSGVHDARHPAAVRMAAVARSTPQVEAASGSATAHAGAALGQGLARQSVAPAKPAAAQPRPSAPFRSASGPRVGDYSDGKGNIQEQPVIARVTLANRTVAVASADPSEIKADVSRKVGL
jgi:RNA polymerase sigma-70 factor (ECF subfamily)